MTEPVIADTNLKIQDYKVRRTLAVGKFATVYEVEDEPSGGVYALKLFHDTDSDQNSLKRFFLEADILLKLQHPGLVKMHKTGMCRFGEASRFYHVTELVIGLPIMQYAERERQSVAQRLMLFLKVCAVINYLHKNGILHRNLKPDNIIIDGHGQPRVIDLMFARLMENDQNLTAPGHIVGNLMYLSPEQIAGDASQYDARMDVYALGGVGYALLSNRPPFSFKGKGLMTAFQTIRGEQPTPLGQIVPSLAGPVEAVIAKAMAKRREDRHATVEALAREIYDCMKVIEGNGA